MKNYFLILLLAVTIQSFAQLTKVATHEPVKINYVEDAGQFVASAEIFPEFTEMVFYEKNTGANVSFGLTNAEFKEVGKLLTKYDAVDKEFYMMQVKRGTLFIRFIEKYGYVQSYVYMNIDGVFWYFIPMNRNQYKRLFAV